jgi:hypothetical protein
MTFDTLMDFINGVWIACCVVAVIKIYQTTAENIRWKKQYNKLKANRG